MPSHFSTHLRNHLADGLEKTRFVWLRHGWSLHSSPWCGEVVKKTGVQTYSSWQCFPRTARRSVMDPTSVCCPHRYGHARGQTGQGNIGIHSRKAQRFMCHAWHKTFSATAGMVF